MSTLVDRVKGTVPLLTPAETKVAEVILADSSLVSFGTVAQLAARSGSSGPTVLRMATKLGFAGFADMQAAFQREMSGQLRPAVERIKTHAAAHPLAQALALEVDNVRATLEAVAAPSFDEAVRRLSDRGTHVFILSGEASAGVGAMIATELDLLRPGVSSLYGSEVVVQREIARIKPGDTILAMELRRYERWVLETAKSAVDAGAGVIALTDSHRSPLVKDAIATFVVSAASAGPFDSHVGTLALCNALVAGVARRLRASATARLEAVEAALTTHGMLA